MNSNLADGGRHYGRPQGLPLRFDDTAASRYSYGHHAPNHSNYGGPRDVVPTSVKEDRESLEHQGEDVDLEWSLGQAEQDLGVGEGLEGSVIQLDRSGSMALDSTANNR
jgi:hypothetical protein